MKKRWIILIALLLIAIVAFLLLKPTTPDLTNYLGKSISEKDFVKVQNIEKYLSRENAPMPSEHVNILEELEEIPTASALKRSDVNLLLEPGYLEVENGYCRLEDGTMYIAALTKMPGVTLEMIDWWFWWHAAEGRRYQIWYPDMHYDITSYFRGSYADTTKTYSERLQLSTHHVNEDVGSGAEDLLIDFMHPTEFGYAANKLDPNKETIICARVGSEEMGSWGSEMTHFVRVTDEGVEMRSRFWIGNKIYTIDASEKVELNPILNKAFIKKILIADEVGPNMFHHCAQEFHNLAEVLPEIYQRENPTK